MAIMQNGRVKGKWMKDDDQDKNWMDKELCPNAGDLPVSTIKL